jgi:Spy/CpxP family protein refolding chaperone
MICQVEARASLLKLYARLTAADLDLLTLATSGTDTGDKTRRYTMRKTLIALMFATALPTIAMAAPGDGPDKGPGFGPGGPGFGGPGMEHHRGEGPFEKLDLSREQREQIGKLMGEEREHSREIADKYLQKLPAADQKALKDEMDANRTKTQADVRAVLKPDQQKAFDEMKKKQDERRAEWAEFQAWKAQKGQKAQ